MCVCLCVCEGGLLKFSKHTYCMSPFPVLENNKGKGSHVSLCGIQAFTWYYYYLLHLWYGMCNSYTIYVHDENIEAYHMTTESASVIHNSVIRLHCQHCSCAKPIPLKVIPYSGKLSREKTFANW